jgi:hypothetical protein
MKNYIFTLIVFFGIGVQSFSNPITPEALIAEVYFDDGNWYAVVDCYLMEMLGINTFQEVDMYCNEGHFNFKDDFLPDFINYNTVITKNALNTPLELNPEHDDILIYWSGGFNFMNLEWGDQPTDPVSGPDEGQSLVVELVHATIFWDYTWWLVKATEPCAFTYECNNKGVFEGYLLDQNNTPITNAEIFYVDEDMLMTSGSFQHLITNDSGYFFHDKIYACNYHIHKIELDDIEYEYDEYISIEPGQTNTYTFLMDFTVIPENPDPSLAFIANYPNPFSNQTTFNISLPAGLNQGDMELKISDVLGRLVASLDIDSNLIGEGNINLTWKNDLPLGAGNYIALLTANGAVLATNKITIK